MTTTKVSPVLVNSQLAGNRNRIINGDMRIDQRNNGVSVTNAVGPAFSVDRFVTYGSIASKFTVQQNAGSITPPAGFVNYVGITSLSAYSVISSDYFLIGQKIEGYNMADLNFGTANAQNITLSFWVYSSLTGTFGGAVQNAAQSRSYPFTYSVSVANTWTNIVLIIPGDTTGAWLTTNAVGLHVWFGLGVGSTLSGTAGAWAATNYNSATGTVSVVGTSGATFYITGVQLEPGTSATAFEHRMYGTELTLCQRYFYTMSSVNNLNFRYSVGAARLTTSAEGILNLPVALRATNPTVTVQNVTSLCLSDANTNVALTAFGIDTAQPSSCLNYIWWIGTTASGLTPGHAVQLNSNNTNATSISFSSEL